MLGISWLNRLSNETVLRKADTRGEVMKMITVRQLRFLGHFNRKEKIEYLAMTGKIAGIRARGRQRMKFMNSIIRRMGVSWPACEVLQASKDRRNWTDIIANVERHGTSIDRSVTSTNRSKAHFSLALLFNALSVK